MSQQPDCKRCNDFGCYECCSYCDYDEHTCGGCGVGIQHGTYDCGTNCTD